MIECLGRKKAEMDKDRFQKVYSQGLVNVAEILVDTQTGVNYLYLSLIHI